MISFDHILESHISIGYFQLKNVFVLGLVNFCDGIDFAFFPIMITILKNEWNLDTNQISIFAGICPLGIVIGNFICAYLADHIGRKVTFTSAAGIAVIMVFLTSLTTEFYQILTLRLFTGMALGTALPITYIVIAEIVTIQYRGRYTLILNLCFLAGAIYLVSMCLIFLDDFTKGNWRGLVQFNTIPMFICFLTSLIFLKETIRFYLNKGQYHHAFQQINLISQDNNINAILQDNEKDGLIKWEQKKKQQLKQQQQSPSLLSSRYREITIKLWCLIGIANNVNFTLYLLIPLLLQSNDQGFGQLIWIYIIEFFAQFVTYSFIDNPNYGGRLRLVIYSSIMILVGSIILYSLHSNFLLVGLVSIKIGQTVLYSTTAILLTESYPLELRSKGSSYAFALGKLQSVPYPFLVYGLYSINPYLPFLVTIIFSGISLIIGFTYPIDRTHQALETLEDDD